LKSAAMFRKPLIIFALLFALSACAATVDYGKVNHARYIDDPRCGAAPSAPTAARLPEAIFLITSRLPDCRGRDVTLTSFRGDQLRYGQVEPPRPSTAKGGPKFIVPLQLSGEARWWADLETAMTAGDGRVLVYVHGYRESVLTNTRDAFQIRRLTEFTGPVIQYSWPSQGALLGYLVDETNLAWDEQNFRRFLTKLATRPWTKEIILVAHSMGARMVIPAVEFVDRNSASADASNISNIILASPDVDRQDFERDIAEEILAGRRVSRDRRITVYVSRRDKALGLSRRLHGYPRLGSPFCFDPFEAEALKAQGLPQRCYAATAQPGMSAVASGLTIIDTTDVGSDRAGHSDFLKTASACLDFKAIVGGERGRTAGRLPTRLGHVFLLPKRTGVSKADELARCRRIN
jgi:pimeloyl-ACP methyl ester carboxylesterase